MKEVSAELFTFLTSLPEFTDVMETKLFPVAANDSVTGSFATYRLINKDSISKDLKTISITLYLWFGANEYSECAEFTDAIEPFIQDEYDWVSSTIDFVEQNQSYVGIINFNTN